MNALPELEVYPPHLLAALDQLLDTLTSQDALVAEDRVMAALHAHSMGDSHALSDVAAEYPVFGAALAASPVAA